MCQHYYRLLVVFRSADTLTLQSFILLDLILLQLLFMEAQTA